MCSLENRKDKEKEVIEKLEKDMQLLCITGVEENLED